MSKILEYARIGEHFLTKSGKTAVVVDSLSVIPRPDNGFKPYVRVVCKLEGEDRMFFYRINGKIEGVDYGSELSNDDYTIVSKSPMREDYLSVEKEKINDIVRRYSDGMTETQCNALSEALNEMASWVCEKLTEKK